MKLTTKHVFILLCLIIVIGFIYSLIPTNHFTSKLFNENRTYPLTTNAHPVELHVDWDEFIELNGSKVVPVGQKVMIPVVFTEASKWRNAIIKLRADSYNTRFNRAGVADIDETAILDGTQPLPIRLYLPITVKDEGYFGLGLSITDSDPEIAGAGINLGVNVFSFEGYVAFADMLPYREIIKQEFRHQTVSEEQLKQEGEKLYQRYLEKHPYIR